MDHPPPLELVEDLMEEARIDHQALVRAAQPREDLPGAPGIGDRIGVADQEEGRQVDGAGPLRISRWLRWTSKNQRGLTVLKTLGSRS